MNHRARMKTSKSSSKKGRKLNTKVVERAKRGRCLGLDVIVRAGGFGVGESATMHALFERVEAITGADGRKYVVTTVERGRSVELDTVASVALARTLCTASRALSELFRKELGIDE